MDEEHRHAWEDRAVAVLEIVFFAALVIGAFFLSMALEPGSI